MQDVFEVLQKLKLTMPPAPQPVGSYLPFLHVGDLLYLSGQLPKNEAGDLTTGNLGRELTVEQGYQAAQLAALNVLSLIGSSVGFDKVDRIVKLVGYVQCTDTFDQIPQVINGASDLFVKIFGEKGKHVRSAVGMISLPLNAAVEIEVILKLKSSD